MSKFPHSEAIEIVSSELVKQGLSVNITSSRDDDVDLYANLPNTKQLKIVVRTISPSKYTWIAQSRFDLNNPQLYMAVVFVKDSSKPEVYLFPASEWKNGSPFVSYAYDKPEQTSKPEYGITFSQKTIAKINSFKLHSFIKSL